MMMPHAIHAAVFGSAATVVAIDLPVGSQIDFHGATLPVGYEIPNGQTLAGTAGSLYPDFYVANGNSLVTKDATGRVVAGKEASATRLTSAVGGVDGATLGAAAGVQSHTLTEAQLPVVSKATGGESVNHTHTYSFFFTSSRV